MRLRGRLADLRCALEELRIRYRRHRLLMAYSKVARRRHGLGPGFSSLIWAYGELDREGLADVTEDGLEWHWPDDETRGSE